MEKKKKVLLGKNGIAQLNICWVGCSSKPHEEHRKTKSRLSVPSESRLRDTGLRGEYQRLTWYLYYGHNYVYKSYLCYGQGLGGNRDNGQGLGGNRDSGFCVCGGIVNVLKALVLLLYKKKP